MGADGLRSVSDNAVLNANYIMKRLEADYDVSVPGPCMHECVMSARRQKKRGVTATDIAKRLLDLGFYAPSTYFPLIVEEALMIEPTETESKETLDAFCDAMIRIARETEREPAVMHDAPVTTPVRRLDQTRAARDPNLKWSPKSYARVFIPGDPRWPRTPNVRRARGTRARLYPRLRERHDSGNAVSTWLLLVTEPCDGATNMAIDDAVLRGRRARTRLRRSAFFGWEPPTGVPRVRPASRTVRDVAACRRLGVGIVRRPTAAARSITTGPERELTYSVLATAEDLGVSVDLLDTYRWIGRALVRGLNALGAAAAMIPTGRGLARDPAFCFARTGAYEIEVGGKKLVGSAQRRQGTSFLQHGAVLLGVDAPRLRALFPTTRDPLASNPSAATGRRPSFEAVAMALRDAFEAEHGSRSCPAG